MKMKKVELKVVTKSLLLVVVAVGVTFTACKKVTSETLLQKNDLSLNKLGHQNSVNSLSLDSAKKVRFQLGTFSSSISNFQDSATKALSILSDVFSTKEFKDSLLTYTFVCSNGSSNSCLASKPKLHRYKCDSVLQVITGQTVYDDLTADSVVNINLQVLASSGSSPYGYTYVCSSTIYSYDWFLKNNNRALPTTQEYAVHLAHEFTHTLGYVHSSNHTAAQDLTSRIGRIVRNILTKRANLAAINGQELHTLLGQDNFKYMKIRVNDLPELSTDFMTAYNSMKSGFDSSNQTITYAYLQFIDSTNAKLGLRVVNSNNTYFVITFNHTMAIDSNGVATFAYTGVNTANATNRARVQHLIDYLTSGSFSLSFMSKSAPAATIVGGGSLLTDPASYFYGIMVDTL